MENNKIAELIFSFFEGKLTPAEKDRLLQWQNESIDNQQIFNDSFSAWKKLQLLEQMEKYTPVKALVRVNAKIENQNRNTIYFGFQKIAAVLILPLLITTLYFAFKKPKQTEQFIAWNKIEIPAGMRSEFYLPDSTKVYLNSKSSLSYPMIFSSTSREVNLIGEAFFEVTRNEDVPFIVNTGRINIEVTGTEFIATRYPHEKLTEIVLVEGGINLFQGNYLSTKKDIIHLIPGEKAICPDDEIKMSVEKVDTEKYTSLKKGILLFRNDPMTEVVLRLNRWFNVDIRLEGPELEDWAYTATFEDETLEQVLELLKISAPIDYKVKRREFKTDKTFSKMEVVIKRI